MDTDYDYIMSWTSDESIDIYWSQFTAGGFDTGSLLTDVEMYYRAQEALPGVKADYNELSKQAAVNRAEANRLDKPADALQEKLNKSWELLKADDIRTEWGVSVSPKEQARIDEYNNLADEQKEAQRQADLARSYEHSFQVRANRVKKVIDQLESYERPECPQWLRDWLKK